MASDVALPGLPTPSYAGGRPTGRAGPPTRSPTLVALLQIGAACNRLGCAALRPLLSVEVKFGTLWHGRDIGKRRRFRKADP